MKLVVVTPPSDIDNEIAFITRMLENGLDRLHLRKENAGIDVYRNYLQQIPAAFYEQVSIHAHPELLKEFPSIGFHCKSSVWKDENKLKDVLSYSSSSIISASFHSWEEVLHAPYEFNYVSISPVFDSISKQDYVSNIDLTKLAAVKQHLTINKKNVPEIYGLGGVDSTRIPQLIQAGFDGAAILGIVWQSENPLTAFETIHRQIKDLH